MSALEPHILQVTCVILKQQANSFHKTYETCVFGSFWVWFVGGFLEIELLHPVIMLFAINKQLYVKGSPNFSFLGNCNIKTNE